MDKNTENLIKKLENPKNKGVKPFVEALENEMYKRELVSELYRYLSDAGIQKLDKVIDSYNNKHQEEPLQKHSDTMKEYEDTIIQTTSLLQEYGEKFEVESQEMDDFIKFQFSEAMLHVRNEDIQDVIDEISKRIVKDVDKETNTLKEQALQLKAQEKQFEVLSRLAKQYGETNYVRIRISNFHMANDVADKLIEPLKFDTKDMAAEEIKEEKARRLNDLKFLMLQKEKTMKPDDFQAVINALDKKLDFEGRKTLDSTIRYHNKNNPIRRYETRRVILSEREKDASWQKFETDSLFKRQLREFRRHLSDIHRHRYRPEGKYDRGIINGALRAIANVNILIAEIAKFIKKQIEYRTKKEVTKKDMSPFYNLIKDAYKEKGSNVVNLLNDGKIDFRQAEDMFINDVAFIKAQIPEKQQELLEEYTNGLRDILKDNIDVRTKTQILHMVSNFEAGKYDEKIAEKTAKGFADVQQEPKSEQQQSTQQQSTQKKDDVIYAYDKNSQGAKKDADNIRHMHNIGKEIAGNEYIDSDQAMQDFVDKISEFSHNNQDMPKEKLNEYTQIAVAVILSHDLHEREYGQELKNFLNQYSGGKFNAMDDKSVALQLLVGASKIDYAQTISADKNKDNPLNKDMHEFLATRLGEMNNAADRKNLVTSIADSIHSDRKQYLFTREAREFALKAVSPKQMSNKHQIDKKIRSLATRYTQMARKENNNLIPTYAFVGLCDKVPDKLGGAQAVYDSLSDILKDNPKALEYMQKDVKTYNEMNRTIGLKEIGDQDLENTIPKEDLENNIFVTPEKTDEISIPAENVEYDMSDADWLEYFDDER